MWRNVYTLSIKACIGLKEYCEFGFYTRFQNYATSSKKSLGINGRGSRVIGRGSKVEVEGHRSRSRVIGRGSKVEVEGQKSRSRVKSRGSKVEIQDSKMGNINFLLIHF